MFVAGNGFSQSRTLSAGNDLFVGQTVLLIQGAVVTVDEIDNDLASA